MTTFKQAKSQAKRELSGQDRVMVVLSDNGVDFEVIWDPEMFEPCIEQTIGEWTIVGTRKEWIWNENFDSDRLLHADDDAVEQLKKAGCPFVDSMIDSGG